MRPGEQGAMIALDPVTGQQMLTQLSQILTEAENQNIRPDAGLRAAAARRRTPDGAAGAAVAGGASPTRS